MTNEHDVLRDHHPMDIDIHPGQPVVVTPGSTLATDVQPLEIQILIQPRSSGKGVKTGTVETFYFYAGLKVVSRYSPKGGDAVLVFIKYTDGTGYFVSRTV